MVVSRVGFEPTTHGLKVRYIRLGSRRLQSTREQSVHGSRVETTDVAVSVAVKRKLGESGLARALSDNIPRQHPRRPMPQVPSFTHEDWRLVGGSLIVRSVAIRWCANATACPGT